MCDTLVAVPSARTDSPVWFGKNSDREPGEAQIVERLPETKFPAGSKLKCTYLEIPQSTTTHEVFVCRPFWMWGAEMGANSRGVAIGNEAVFTRLPYEKIGLTGMDLVRLGLERGATARDTLEIIVDLISRHSQGGGCGFRNRSFRYHNSFIIADPLEAWVLETAGPHWAAERVSGVRTISNALSIGRHFDLISKEAFSFAKSRGWCKSAEDFHFADAYSDPRYTRLSGGALRSACTAASLNSANRADSASMDQDHRLSYFMAALRDHAGLNPSDGWVMKMPCAHASWRPARRAGQTTGSMIASLSTTNPTLWFTGTSSPCLSVFKPARFGSEILSPGPEPGEGYDPNSLFWRHERLHRLVLGDYESRKQLFERDRLALEQKALALADTENASNTDFRRCWDEHWQAIAEWTSRVLNESAATVIPSPFRIFWTRQESLDKFPIDEASKKKRASPVRKTSS